MNKTKLLYLLGGAIIGGTAGFLITHFIIDKKQKEEIEELKEKIDEQKDQINLYKAFLKNLGVITFDSSDEDMETLHSIILDNGYDSEDDSGEAINFVDEDTPQDYMDYIHELDEDKEYGPDESVFDGYMPDVIDDSLDDEPEMNMGPPEDTDFPYVISEIDYSEDRPDFTKCLCQYFMKGGALCDAENGAIYEDLSVIGGLNMIAALEAFKGDVIYVRNEPQMCDFEIKKIYNMSYADKWE